MPRRPNCKYLAVKWMWFFFQLIIVFTWISIKFLHLYIANYLMKKLFALGIIIYIFKFCLGRSSSWRLLLLIFRHVAHGLGWLIGVFFSTVVERNWLFCINFRKKKLCPLDRSSLNPRSRTVSSVFGKINVKLCHCYFFVWW